VKPTCCPHRPRRTRTPKPPRRDHHPLAKEDRGSAPNPARGRCPPPSQGKLLRVQWQRPGGVWGEAPVFLGLWDDLRRLGCRPIIGFALSRMLQQPVYKRVLLKVSGEALMGRREYGLDTETVTAIAIDVRDVVAMVPRCVW